MAEVVLSDEAAAHLASLMQHRPDTDRMVVEVVPARCELCREIADWSQKLHRSVAGEGEGTDG